MAWRITNKGQLDSVNFRFRATMPTRCPQLTERRVHRVQVGGGHELVHPGG